jgi:phage FluMu protein Com
LSDREEAEIRCSNCNRYLTKIILTKSVPTDMASGEPISRNGVGIEVKVGIETKCHRCHEFDNRVIVI